MGISGTDTDGSGPGCIFTALELVPPSYLLCFEGFDRIIHGPRLSLGFCEAIPRGGSEIPSCFNA
jgi:hypothetical protein